MIVSLLLTDVFKKAFPKSLDVFVRAKGYGESNPGRIQTSIERSEFVLDATVERFPKIISKMTVFVLGKQVVCPHLRRRIHNF